MSAFKISQFPDDFALALVPADTAAHRLRLKVVPETAASPEARSAEDRVERERFQLETMLAQLERGGSALSKGWSLGAGLGLEFEQCGAGNREGSAVDPGDGKLLLMTGKDKMAARLRGHPAMAKLRNYYDRLTVLAPKSVSPYASLAGLSEWAVHPGLDDEEARAVNPGGWRVRRTDYEFLTSPEAHELVRREGIVLTDYRIVQQVWTRSGRREAV